MASTAVEPIGAMKSGTAIDHDAAEGDIPPQS
jgi:hypothetical protein